MRHFSTFSPWFPARSRQPAAFVPNIFHKHLPLLFLCTHSLLRMHSHSHAACIYQLDSFLFNLQGLTHASLYSNQLLHQPAFTNTLLHQAIFAETHFYPNQLLHKPAFTQTRFSADHLLHQPALHTPCFGPVGQRPEGQRNAESC